MQKWLVGAGLLLVVAGLAWPWLSKLPLGQLPGDIVFRREGFRFYLPLTSMLSASLLLSLLLWCLRR